MEHLHDNGEQSTQQWTVPESWEIEKEVTAHGASSGSEESLVASSSLTFDDSSSTATNITMKKRMCRKTHYAHKQTPSTSSSKFVLVCIYCANGSYRVAQIPPHATVADLIPSLNAKVLCDSKRDTHKLYLKEQGRERVLAPTERPTAITRRRLEQARYDQIDSLNYLAVEDMTFLLKFVYKSQLLGSDLNIDNFGYVDLTGCATIPIIFHVNAASIALLDLSQHAMVEIPLESCTALRKLRLSNMAMKKEKVPQSVRHSASLHRLDLSCNRIVDLDDAGLDRIPGLSILKLQNNRIEQLPWYFPRLRMLMILNISSSKFSRHLRDACPAGPQHIA
ncbi:hypothetical protein JVT61DRAFT_3935 [Boletus reticuloceps]|uniref:Ras-associating domain-containing protein n=1 Tax=Boletus reticuloceps TaxID=495285 RepID=A0A8I3A7H9_9AGAM|nr:hypothetical protein JVT61DRAFT_3935 [Boletus reticuloceps]